jgi:hypothetical protein
MKALLMIAACMIAASPIATAERAQAGGSLRDIAWASGALNQAGLICRSQAMIQRSALDIVAMNLDGRNRYAPLKTVQEWEDEGARAFNHEVFRVGVEAACAGVERSAR